MNKPIKTYNLYEVIKVPFPFTDEKGTKVRPALVLSSARRFNAKLGLSIMAMITSAKPDRELWPTDIQIDDLKLAGLPVASIIRFKLFTLDHRLILGSLGRLGRVDQKEVQQQLKNILGL